MNTDKYGCTDCRGQLDANRGLLAALGAERDRLAGELDKARETIAVVAQTVGADHEDYGEVLEAVQLAVAAAARWEREESRKQVEALKRQIRRIQSDETIESDDLDPDEPSSLAAARAEARQLDAHLKAAQARVIGLHTENLQLRRMMGVEP